MLHGVLQHVQHQAAQQILVAAKRNVGRSVRPDGDAALGCQHVDRAAAVGDHLVQIQIHRSNGSPDIPFRGDEDLLRRLVLNVLQNAVQHTPSGGSVAVDIQQDPEAVRIRVTDEGPGIPQDDQQRIFDRFVQLDASRRGQGTGLGLPIARWIADAHRGTLVVERSGPGGTTFCVSLPTA